MGISGISIWQLLIVLAIVVMLFGTKRLRTLGSDLGSMIKGFKSSMSNEEAAKAEEEQRILEQQQKAATAQQQPAEKVDQNNKV